MIIDRIEDDIVVCEDENGLLLNVEMSQFITPIKDGDVVVKNEEGFFVVDIKETQKRKESIENRFNNLFK